MAVTRRDLAALGARGLDAVRLLARDRSQGDVAQALGVSRVSAHRWYHARKAQGRAGLKRAGRPQTQLSAAALAIVERALPCSICF